MRPIVQLINHTLDALPNLHHAVFTIRLPILDDLPIDISQLVVRPAHGAQRREVLLGPHLGQAAGDDGSGDESRHDTVDGDVLVAQQGVADGAREAHARVFARRVLRCDRKRILPHARRRDHHLGVERRLLRWRGALRRVGLRQLALRFARVVHEQLQPVQHRCDVDVHAERVRLLRLLIQVEGLQHVLLVACPSVGGKEIDAVLWEAFGLPVVGFLEEVCVVFPHRHVRLDKLDSVGVER